MPEIVYTDRLSDKFRKIFETQFTVVMAPAGCGKTSALKKFAKTSGIPYKWININNSSAYLFWTDFCDTLSEIDPNIKKALDLTGESFSEKTISQIRHILKSMKVSEEICIFIDNYQIISDEYFDLLFCALNGNISSKLHICIISNGSIRCQLSQLIMSRDITFISKPDFWYDEKGIIKVFSANGIEISEKQAEKIFQYTEGYIYFIGQILSDCMQTGGLKLCVKDMSLLETEWRRTKNEEKQYLIAISYFDSFTLKEARTIIKNDYNSEEIINYLNISPYLKVCDNNILYIPGLIRDFLIKKGEIALPEEKNIIGEYIGTILILRGRLIEAYRNFYESGNFEAIYGGRPGDMDLYPNITGENKELFMKIITECPNAIRDKYYNFTVPLCILLFLYNEKEFFKIYLEETEERIENQPGISQAERAKLDGIFYFAKGYTYFNSLEDMVSCYEKADRIVGKSVSPIKVNIPFMFGCPSMLFLFHRGNSCDDELSLMDKMMPIYCRITNGHGKGANALFRAEMLFNKGEFVSTEALCHKAIYMAQQRNQTEIIISAMLLIARLSVCMGECEKYLENIKKVGTYINDKHGVQNVTSRYFSDMCEAWLWNLLGETEKIPEWLKNYETIENKLNLISLAGANVIYGKYLLDCGEYRKFMGLSGQFLKVTQLFSQRMAEIYTYIQIAVANHKTSNNEKAVSMLKKALELSYEDGLVMPFVEYMEDISEVLEEFKNNKTFVKFIGKIKSSAKVYYSALTKIRNSYRKSENFGLTKRELSVASLAAKRLSNKEIAEELVIAESTVKSNLKSVFAKLNIKSRAELAALFKK